MARKLFDKKAIFVGLESTYGVDTNPSATPTKAVLTKNLSITPIEGNELKRALDTGTLGADSSVLAGVHSMVEFDIDMASSGAAGTAPAYAPLLMGCGFAQTDLSADPDPRFEYDLVDENFDALGFYTFIDGTLHKLLGARGDMSVKASMQNYGDFHFKFTGMFVPISESSAPARDYIAFKTPLPNSAINTELTVHAKTVSATDVNLALNNNVVFHETTTGQEILITDRQPNGSFVMEAPNVGGGDFDVWSRAADKTTGPYLYQQGQSSGNIVIISGPALEVGKPTYSDQNKIAMVNVPFVPLDSSAGNDAVKITIK